MYIFFFQAKYDQRQAQKKASLLPKSANNGLSEHNSILLQNNYNQTGFQDKVYFEPSNSISLSEPKSTNFNSQSMLQVPISRMPKAYSVVSLDSMT